MILKQILIIKSDELRNLVLAVPSFRMMRKTFPNSRISLLVDSKLISLIEKCPYIDECIGFDQSKRHQLRYILSSAQQLRNRKFDLSIDLQNTWRTHLLAFLAAIPRRFGYKRRIAGFLLTDSVEFDEAAITNVNPVQHQFEVLKRCGVIEFDDALELWTKPEDEISISQKFEEAGINSSQLIGLVIATDSRWTNKRWPIEQFLELSKLLIKNFNCQIILLGRREDQELGEVFDRSNLERVFNLIGKTTLPQLVALIKRLDVLITTDAVSLHIASACGTRTVSLFGPTDSKWNILPPSVHISLSKHLPCQPCRSPVCSNPQQFLCMREIEVDEVCKAVEKQLEFAGDSVIR